MDRLAEIPQLFTVEVTFPAERRDFEFLRADEIKVMMQLWNARKGVRKFPITSRDLTYPKALRLEDIEPREVQLDIGPEPAPANGRQRRNRFPDKVLAARGWAGEE